MNQDKKLETIAIVVPRYGLDIQGGEERRARYFAELLIEKYNVHVITTKAKDFATWKNEYEVDEEIINKVTIKRFATDHCQLDHGKYSNPNSLLNASNSFEQSELFVKAVGPYSTPLLDYLSNNQHIYKKIIYMPYLYATTYFGIKLTDKSRNILAPAAHDENYLRYKYMSVVFTHTSSIIFNTFEEKKLIYKLYPATYNTEIVGIPIEPEAPGEYSELAKKYNLNRKYLLYFGRIDTGKQVDQLINYFIQLKVDNPKLDLDLVLTGKTYIDIPKREDIKFLGFLPEEEKSTIIQNAWVVVLPSYLESFSITTLEAMYFGVPVLVNGFSEVLVGHCKRSNGGLWYENFAEFSANLLYLYNNISTYVAIGKNASVYAKSNYSTQSVKNRLIDFISQI